MKKLITLTIALVAACSLLSACGPPQTITICKQTIPAGGTGFPFSWAQGSSGTIATFSLNDTQCNAVNVAGLDHFNRFTENVPPGWTLTNISCNYTTSAVKIIGANANPAFEPGDDTVTIDLNESNVTCTFVNQPPACCAYTLDVSTGQGGGVTDPLWTVDGGAAYITPPTAGWISLPPAQWIQPVPSPTPSWVSAKTYSYVARFDFKNCSAGHVELTGTFAADNSATASLDGVAIPGAACSGLNCFSSPDAPIPLNFSPILLSSSGPHTLQIDVTNDGGYSGLIVSARIRRVCP